MDIGTFKASRGRLIAWIVIPPALIASVGMGSYAWQQRAEWRLQQAQALTDVLPSFISARAEANRLVDELGLNEADAVRSEDQLIALVQKTALAAGFTIDAVQVERRGKSRENEIPLLHASVEGTGDFREMQRFAARMREGKRLLSVSSVELMQPRVQESEDDFKARLVFDLLLIEEVLEAVGGAQ